MKPSIGIIINLNAKQNRKHGKDPVALYETIGGNHVIVRSTCDTGQIRDVAREFRKKGIAYLGVCGGDGSLHHVISEFLQVYRSGLPPILALKGGTMDTVSRTIKLKGKGPCILRRMIAAMRSGRTPELHTRDTIRVGKKHCFLFGLGISSNFLREYYEGGDPGPVKAVKVAARGIAGGIFGGEVGSLFTRFNACVDVDGECVPFNDFLGILAATVDNVGIGFRPLFRAYEENGTFHAIFAGFGPATLVKQIYRFKTGKPLRHPHYHETVGRRMRISSPGPIPYMMDGDLYEARDELVVESGRRVTLVRV